MSQDIGAGAMSRLHFLVPLFIGVVALAVLTAGARAEVVTVGGVRVIIDHNSAEHANPGFYFADASRPLTNDDATGAAFSIIEGEPAPNTGGLNTLHDGKLPSGPDRPDQNFFFKDVQQYEAREDSAGAGSAPSWLVEGMADYIRWFLFEPQSHGAEITRANLAQAHYDASYRITANFLNWVVKQYGANVIARLNASARKHEYEPGLWKKLMGRTPQALDREWRAALKEQVEGRVVPSATAPGN
jgi:Peptidase of plants and bacteria